MKRKIPRTRLIITALIFGLAAIPTTLAQKECRGDAPAGQHRVRCDRPLRTRSTR